MKFSTPGRDRLRGAAIACLAMAGIVALSGCTAEDALRPTVGVGSSAAAPGTAGTGAALFGFPMVAQPEVAVMPESEIACRKRLSRMGVSFVDLPRIDEGNGCGIDYPLKVSRLPGGVELKPAATLNCRMTEAFARWTDEELTPAARLRYFSGVATIHQGSSYACRTIGNRRGGKLSEHAKGNALDVMYLTLKNGKDIDVRKPGLFAFRQRGLLHSVRSDACSYFSTVLGPGYDRAHRDHFHFDLMARRGGRACR